MKNLAFILGSLMLVVIGITSCTDNGKKTPTTVVKTDSTGKKVEVAVTRIAYVDIDSLEEQYDYFQKKKVEFESRGKKIENELRSKSKAIENSYISLQKKAQAGSLSQAEGEKLQKSLMNRQENLEKLKNNLGTKLLKDRDAFNKTFREKLEKVVAEYNKGGKYDFILINSVGGSFLYYNPDLDITDEIVKRMNATK